MASKATAALMRLREIDQKYKHRYEDKKNPSDSDDDDDDNGKDVSRNEPILEIYKPQLNIKIPDAYEDYLDTNSSNDNNEHSVAVRIVNGNDNKLSKSSSKISEIIIKRKNSSAESMEEIDNLKGEINKDENIEVPETATQISNEELSISENLDNISNSIPELSKKSENDSGNNLSLAITVESIESSDDEDKLIIDGYSKNSSQEKYLDDTFESNSSGENKSKNELISPVLLSSKKSEISKNIEKIDEINTKEIFDKAKNNNDTDISTVNDIKMIESSTNYSQISPEGDINNDTHKIEPNNDKLSIISNNNSTSIENNKISTDASNSYLKSSIKHDNKYIEHENSVKSTVQGESSMSFKNSEKYSHDLITTQTKDKNSYNNSDDKIGTKKYTKKKVQRHRRRKKNTEDNEREYTVSKKMLEQKMLRDHVRFRHEHKRIHSTMIYHLEKMREERRKLHLFWPNRLICPERIDVGRTIKPLDFPNVSSFIRPSSDDLINQHPDPNVDILRNRLFDIRQWLKNQYLIYKEHCSVAATINKTYSCDFTVDTTKLSFPNVFKENKKKPKITGSVNILKEIEIDNQDDFFDKYHGHFEGNNENNNCDLYCWF
ncbi:hypothetical protein PV327_004416 [Microctonus hyperodae]|uniref:Uncharacterized protein n=1 Tax=Microctonus hyperodae TaxID=165561 RepID=A0AA39FCC5_MICHY|nr:hypothetical protein PV327_004416 [Microctonus hyperodae]